MTLMENLKDAEETILLKNELIDRLEKKVGELISLAAAPDLLDALTAFTLAIRSQVMKTGPVLTTTPGYLQSKPLLPLKERENHDTHTHDS